MTNTAATSPAELAVAVAAAGYVDPTTVTATDDTVVIALADGATMTVAYGRDGFGDAQWAYVVHEADGEEGLTGGYPAEGVGATERAAREIAAQAKYAGSF